MWTNENRARYDRSQLRYPSDLTDDEWKLVEPLIPPGRRGGDKRRIPGANTQDDAVVDLGAPSTRSVTETMVAQPAGSEYVPSYRTRQERIAGCIAPRPDGRRSTENQPRSPDRRLRSARSPRPEK